MDSWFKQMGELWEEVLKRANFREELTRKNLVS
jgi:hypothetical protein